MQEDIIAATSSKVPSVRAEVCMFLNRAFSNMTVTTLNKKLLKAFVSPLIKCSTDTAAEVREASFAALGTAMYVVTEKNITPFLADVDAIRMGRIKEFYEKTVEEKKNAGGGSTKAPAPSQATAASAASTATEAAKGPPKTAVKAGAKPGGGAKKEGGAASSRPGTAAAKPPAGKGKSGAAQSGNDLPKESLMGDDAVEAKLTEYVTLDISSVHDIILRLS